MENNVSGQKSAGEQHGAEVRRSRGRPRRWADGRERRAAYRSRTREWTRRLEELYVALVNARWDEPEVQRAVDSAADEEVVQVLTDYFRRRRRQRP